jgi:DNA-binding CsgD family transcriptional regulator
MPHFEDFVEQAQHVNTVTDLKTLFQTAVHAEGYENIGFAVLDADHAVETLWEEFPSGYTETYRNEHWERIDPILHHAPNVRRPFLWNDLLTARCLTPRQVAFFERCREIGVHSGLTMPFHSPGGIVHLFSVSLRRGPPPAPSRIPYIYALAAQSWVRDCELREKVPPPAPKGMRVTRRELECLKWVKEGKTNWEISCIVGIAERTVEFHIGNAAKKLQATNRVAAVVTALQRGLLQRAVGREA